MAHDYLEINRLSPTGDIERRINCISGRITVFRSTKEEDTSIYNLALSGKSAPGTFSLLLDGDSFEPSEHNLVGFGEKFAISTKLKVNDYLSEIPSEKRERALLSCGLGGLGEVFCGELSAGQERIIRILKGTLEPDKVLILNDPFEGIPERFREILAESLTRFAWDKKAIVIVTKLSTRPESWIENEFISRVQLQRPRQATIGFGSGDASINKLVESVRKSVGAEIVPTGKPIDLLSKPTSTHHPRLSIHSKWLPLGFAAFLLLALLPFSISWLLNTESKEITPATRIELKTMNTSSTEKNVGNSSAVQVVSPPLQVEVKEYLLDGYPQEIRDGIRLAFLGKTSSSNASSMQNNLDSDTSGNKTMERLLHSLRAKSQ